MTTMHKLTTPGGADALAKAAAISDDLRRLRARVEKIENAPCPMAPRFSPPRDDGADAAALVALAQAAPPEALALGAVKIALAKPYRPN